MTQAPIVEDVSSLPPGEEEAILHEIKVLDFRRSSFLQLAKIHSCPHCGSWGSWWDSDPPETFYCECPAGEGLLARMREQAAEREGMLIRWARRDAERAARPSRPWVRPPHRGEPGGAVQAVVRRLQRLGASAGWVDLFAGGWRGPDMLEALCGRPWEGPDVDAKPGRLARPYLLARARWIARDAAEHAVLAGRSTYDSAQADHWAEVATRWLDLAEVK